MLVAIYACNFVDRMIVSVVAQPIKAEMRLSDAQIDWLGGFAFASFYAVTAIPLARLAERKKRVAIITVCMAAIGVLREAEAGAKTADLVMPGLRLSSTKQRASVRALGGA